MRNPNIFVRKDTAAQHNLGNGLPVFALVSAFDGENVFYSVDYLEYDNRTKNTPTYWHYADNDNRSGTSILPLDKFLERFMPDYSDTYAEACTA